MRKKLLLSLIAVAILLLPLGAIAETTGGADWDKDLGWANGIRDYVGGHSHDYEQYDPKFEVGAGLDLIVQERKETQNNLTPLKTTVESKYDFNNENGSVYVVATYRVSEVWTGITDLFGGGE